MSPRIEPVPASRSSAPPGSRLGLIAFALMLIVATLALPSLGLAAVSRAGDDVTIAAVERINDDLFASARTFFLEGRVDGELYVAANEVDIPGRVEGAVYLAAGDVAISGTVEHSVRVAARDTEITGAIDGDLVVLGATTTIGPTASVSGSVVVYGGSVTVAGTVGGSVNGSVGSADISGTVAGDVNLTVRELDVASTAQIGGSLVYTSWSEGDIAPGAGITGTIDHHSIAPWGDGIGLYGKFFSPLVRMLWLLIAGAVMIALAPRLASALNDNLRRTWIAIVAGAVAIVVFPAVAILLMISVIGIPIGLVLLSLFVVALYFSQVVVGQRIGSWILPRRWNDGSRGYLLLAMTIGVILISALRFIPLPYLGAAINLLVVIIGFGGVVLLIRQLRPVSVLSR